MKRSIFELMNQKYSVTMKELEGKKLSVNICSIDSFYKHNFQNLAQRESKKS